MYEHKENRFAVKFSTDIDNNNFFRAEKLDGFPLIIQYCQAKWKF